MLKHLLVLPDGTEISSGAPGAAIRSLTLSRSVNETQALTLGSACAAMVEATLLNIEPGRIAAGDELTLYAVEQDGTRHRQGIFRAEKPERLTAHTLRLTAYDRMILLDKELTAYIAGLEGWPYTLQELAELVCSKCGVTLAGGDIPNGGHPVQRFSAEGVTGRQILRWIAEAAGRFVRATAAGDIEFAWYAPADISVGPSPIGVAEARFAQGCLTLRAEGAAVTDEVSVTSPHLSLQGDGEVTLILSDDLLRQYCFSGGMTLSEFAVAPIEKVQLRQDEEDLGTVWPDGITEAVNTYIITANPLLSAQTADTLLPVAQTLYEQLQGVSYTPCTLKIPATPQLDAGSILGLMDTAGNTYTVYVMTLERSGQQDILTCAGTPLRDNTEDTNNRRYAALSGKVLRLRTDVDGIKAENADAGGRLTRLELDLDGIRGQVQTTETTAQGLQTQLTQLTQTAETISAAVSTMEENGVSKVTTQFGMTIDGSAVTIARSDSNMENKLNEKGMYVIRQPGTGNETVMLRADADGVLATDVSVRNYLIVGGHARLEDYTDGTDTKRTACFFLGG